MPSMGSHMGTLCQIDGFSDAFVLAGMSGSVKSLPAGSVAACSSEGSGTSVSLASSSMISGCVCPVSLWVQRLRAQVQ